MGPLRRLEIITLSLELIIIIVTSMIIFIVINMIMASFANSFTLRARTGIGIKSFKWPCLYYVRTDYASWKEEEKYFKVKLAVLAHCTCTRAEVCMHAWNSFCQICLFNWHSLSQHKIDDMSWKTLNCKSLLLLKGHLGWGQHNTCGTVPLSFFWSIIITVNKSRDAWIQKNWWI